VEVSDLHLLVELNDWDREVVDKNGKTMSAEEMRDGAWFNSKVFFGSSA